MVCISGFRQLVDDHSLASGQARVEKKRILGAFPYWVEDKTWSSWHFALHRFVNQAPFKFFDASVVEKVIEVLTHDAAHLLDLLEREDVSLSHAIFSVLRPREGWSDERPLSLRDTRDVLRIDRVIHSDYVHYVEHVFQHLVRLVVLMLGRREGCDLSGGDLPAWVERLNEHGFATLTRGYNRNVRNALSHGGVNYQEMEIFYLDRSGTVSLKPSELGRLHDDMVDACSALLFALIIALSRTGPSPDDAGFRRLPLGLMYLHLEANHRYPGLSLDRIADGDFPGRGRQLMLFATSTANARRQHMYDGLCLAAKALRGCRGRYQRVGIVIDSGRATSGAWFIPAAVIERAYAKNLPMADLAGQLGNSVLLWDDTNLWRGRIQMAWQMLQVALAELPVDLRRVLADDDAGVIRLHYYIRSAEESSAGSYRRWFVHTIVPGSNWQTPERLEQIAGEIGLLYSVRPLRGFDLTKKTGIPLPPSEVVIHLYKMDRRLRGIGTTHEGNRNLLKVIRWKSPLATLND